MQTGHIIFSSAALGMYDRSSGEQFSNPSPKWVHRNEACTRSSFISMSHIRKAWEAVMVQWKAQTWQAQGPGFIAPAGPLHTVEAQSNIIMWNKPAMLICCCIWQAVWPVSFNMLLPALGGEGCLVQLPESIHLSSFCALSNSASLICQSFPHRSCLSDDNSNVGDCAAWKLHSLSWHAVCVKEEFSAGRA